MFGGGHAAIHVIELVTRQAAGRFHIVNPITQLLELGIVYCVGAIDNGHAGACAAEGGTAFRFQIFHVHGIRINRICINSRCVHRCGRHAIHRNMATLRYTNRTTALRQLNIDAAYSACCLADGIAGDGDIPRYITRRLQCGA